MARPPGADDEHSVALYAAQLLRLMNELAIERAIISASPLDEAKGVGGRFAPNEPTEERLFSKTL